MARRYPLEPLERQREHAVDRETAELSREQRRSRVAAERHTQASAERAQQQSRISSERARSASAQGAVRAQDLVSQARFDTHARTRLTELESDERATLQDKLEQQRKESGQKDRLAGALARAKAVTSNRERWEEQRVQRAHKHEEELAQEQWLARQPKTSRR